MIPYRSELLMTSSPTFPADEKTIAGRSFERKNVAAGSLLGKAAEDEFVSVRRQTRPMLAGTVKVKTEPNSAFSTLTGTPSSGNEVTLHHQLVATGIAQSKLIADRQHQSRFNDCKVAYRKNIIAGKERLIEEKRFQVSASDSCNQSHTTYLNDLQILIQELAVAYDELHKLKFLLIEEQELQDAIVMKAAAGNQGGMTTNATAVAIDLTLRSVFDQSTTTSSEGPEDDAEQRKKRRTTSTSTAQVTESESDKNESQNDRDSQC